MRTSVWPILPQSASNGRRQHDFYWKLKHRLISLVISHHIAPGLRLKSNNWLFFLCSRRFLTSLLCIETQSYPVSWFWNLHYSCLFATHCAEIYPEQLRLLPCQTTAFPLSKWRPNNFTPEKIQDSLHHQWRDTGQWCTSETALMVC